MYPFPNPYAGKCYCCLRRAEKGPCPCVYSTCRRCTYCLQHCICPERHARCDTDTELEALDTELDDPEGPFADLGPGPNPAKPGSKDPG